MRVRPSNERAAAGDIAEIEQLLFFLGEELALGVFENRSAAPRDRPIARADRGFAGAQGDELPDRVEAVALDELPQQALVEAVAVAIMTR